MFKPKNKVHFLYFCADLVLIFFSFFIPYLLRQSYNPSANFGFKGLILSNPRDYLFIFILWGILIIGALKRKDLYSTDRTLSIPREIHLVLVSLLSSSLIIAATIFFAKFKFFSRLTFLLSLVFLCLSLTMWRVIKRLIVRYLIKKGFHSFNVLIVGADRIAKLLLGEIKSRPFLGFNVAGAIDDSEKDCDSSLPILGKLTDFEEVCRKYFIDEVFISTPSQKSVVSKITEIAKNMRIGIRVVPLNFKEAPSSININYLGVIPLLTYKERETHPAELVLKRFFDFLSALFLLIILSPVSLIISILIKIDSPGSVFYTQKRMGRKDKMFNFYKFRTMVKDADRIKSTLMKKNESKGDVIFKIKKDPRITRVGGFLRKSSLDELPQLVNVLKGDMSLVGPRPFPVEESKKLKHNHMPRLNIRPGITGLAQVRGRSDLSFYRWAKWDLWYINHWSFELDLQILWWTIPTVFKGKGAY